jgi:choice-of-anchor B domain-containing protein
MGYTFVSFLIISFISIGQSYNNINLLDKWSNDDLVTNSLQNRYNECWGFVQKNQEYAVIGSSEGTHIFLINNQNKFVEIDFIRGLYSNANVVHRDYKTYKNYLYAVCDEGESSLQIIDLQYLPDSVHLSADLVNFGRNHNIGIDSINSLLYCFSQKSFNGSIPISAASIKVYSLDDPLNPIEVFGGFNDIPEVHDGLIRDNIALLNCGSDGLRRYDFTNPSSPLFIQNMFIYQDQGYNHQGDLSPSGDTYIFADETKGKKLKKCSVAANGEIKVETYFGTDTDNESVPHNIMLDDRFVYVAYYNLGLRIYDYRSSPVQEIAFYDTYPDESSYKLNGMWGVYSKLPSGRIIASDRKYGLFLFDFNRDVFINRTNTDFQVYPNPIQEGGELTVFLNENFKGFVLLRLLDISGREVFRTSVTQQNYITFSPNLKAAAYQLEISYEQNLETKTQLFPIVVF